MTKVSIIMAAYNAEGTIGAALKSIPAAVSSDYEILVCDDGSTDATVAMVAHYPFADKCKVLSAPNAGPSAARNRGLAAATGDYIFYFDADDELAPQAINRLLAVMRHGHVAAYGNYVNMDATGNVLPRPWWVRLLRPSGNVVPKLLLANFIVVGSVLIRRDVLQKLGGFNTALRFGEDWALWCAVAAEGTVGYAGDAPVLKYRRHASSTTQTLNDVSVIAAPTLDAVFGNAAIVKHIGPLRAKFLRCAQEAHMLHLQAIREARLGHKVSAWKTIVRAMFHCAPRAPALFIRFLANIIRIG